MKFVSEPVWYVTTARVRPGPRVAHLVNEASAKIACGADPMGYVDRAPPRTRRCGDCEKLRAKSTR